MPITAAGRTRTYDAGAIRHSVGGKVAGDTRLWKCCNPDTYDGKRLWLTRAAAQIEPFAGARYYLFADRQ